MKFTRNAVLGLSLIGLSSGCSETDTTVSVNVRYWTDFLDAESFMVTIEQEGRTTIESPIVPRDLGEGKFDVVCDHDWELAFCRYYKRFDVSGWAESDVRVTFSGKTKDGTDIEAFVAQRGIGDQLSKTFELEANEVNVVYFQLPNVKVQPDPVSPDTSDTNDDGGTSGAAGDGGTSGAASDGGSTSGVTDGGEGAAEAGAFDAAVDGAVPDASANDTSAPDASASDTVGTSDAGAADGGTSDAEGATSDAQVADAN